jgi:hypothetical protein
MQLLPLKVKLPFALSYFKSLFHEHLEPSLLLFKVQASPDSSLYQALFNVYSSRPLYNRQELSMSQLSSSLGLLDDPYLGPLTVNHVTVLASLAP